MFPYGIISVRRTVEIEGAVHPYRVLIDGVLAGKVRTGRTVEFPVAPGSHHIRVAQAWAGSAPLLLEVRPGSRHYLLTGTGRQLDAFIHPKRYLRLVLVGAADA